MSVILPPSFLEPQPRREDFRRGSNYWLARFSEQLRGPLRQGALRLSGGIKPSSPQEWRTGLIIGPSHIGDVLYNTASLPALQNGLPHCAWTYLVSGSSAQVLKGNPHLQEVISVDDSGNLHVRLRLILKALRKKHFDVAIAYASGTSWRDLTLAALLGIPNRVGYVHKGFSGLITHPVSIRMPQPFPAYFRDLVSQLVGHPSEMISSLKPLVYPQPEHKKTVDQISARMGLDWTKQPVLACAVTTRQPSGVGWPQAEFLKTIRWIREAVPCTIVYLGAKTDAEILAGLVAQTGVDTFALAGELDLLSIVSFLGRCRVALTTDSGPRHLANAAGIPVVFVRNMSVRQVETGAYCNTDYDMAPKGKELLSLAEIKTAFAQINARDVAAKVIGLLQKWDPVRSGGIL